MPKSVRSNSKTYQDSVENTLAKNRIIDMGGFIGPDTLFDLSKRLRYLALSDDKPIRIFLNTPGGSVLDGFGIYDLIRSVNPKSPVTVCALGSCMSMGTIILQAAHRRQAFPNTTFLLHELRGDNGGTLSQMKDTQQHVEKLQEHINSIYIQRTGLGKKRLEALLNRRDFYFNAQEALELNLIDEIVEV